LERACIMVSVKHLTFTLFFVCGVSNAVETWECQEGNFRNWSNILVIASINEMRNGGEIKVAGTTYQTVFYNAGFERRWDFGLTPNNLNYSFLISPDGLGRYYDFSTSNDGKAKASMFFNCRERLTDRK